MNYSIKTHQGKRKDNQDYAAIFFNQSNLLLAVLCDGLGGHQAGDIASEMAVSQIGNSWEQTTFTSKDTYLVQKWLNEAINRENTRIFEAANTYSDLEGMGTTLVAGVVLAHQVLFANVGDSRAYTYKNGELRQITDDHSFVSELVRRGELSETEAQNHVNRNTLTRSLGVDSEIDVDFFKVLRSEVEIILLNSDGLSNALTSGEMIEILDHKKNVDQKSEELITKAVENEASDNVTVNLIDLRAELVEEAGEENE